jgi:hypothetical protein
MDRQARDSKRSPDEMKREYRRLAREIQEALDTAKIRRSMMGLVFLADVPSLYDIDPSVIKEVEKIKGEHLHKLTDDLFRLFAKVGKRTSDEVLKVRIQDLFAKYVAESPRGGRRKKS